MKPALAERLDLDDPFHEPRIIFKTGPLRIDHGQ